MTNTLFRNDPKRRHTGKLCPHFDRLDSRIVLSTTTGLSIVSAVPVVAETTTPLADNLTVVGIDPALGKTLSGFPSSVKITFDRPIDPNSIGIDLLLNLVNSDGSLTSIDSIGNYEIETPDPDGRSIDLTTSQPLSLGTYTLVLSGNAFVVGLDGSSVSFNDQTLSQFTIRLPGVGLADATELGSPTDTTVSDRLDITNTPQAIKLYRIELPATQSRWRLGVEVDSTRIGSALTTALSVFDAQGNVIATSQVGRADFPNDPFLFEGLKPGVYYVGVSGAGNDPGTTGGYDIKSATPGFANSGVQSGAFQLQIVADPATTLTQVKTFFLNYADLTDSTPTGLTLQFNGPIDATALSENSGNAIAIVDAQGTIWTAHATNYNDSQASATFVFDRTLPQGNYSVKLTGQGGLVDLSDQAPVSAGYPVGTLQMFNVGPTQAKADPYDLGPIAPHDATVGVNRNLTLGSNQSVTYRLVITVPGAYSFQTTSTGGTPSFLVTHDGESDEFKGGATGELNRFLIDLKPGVVTFKVVGGVEVTSLALRISLPGSSFEQLLDNGVGQSTALGLRLISPTSLTAGGIPSYSVGAGPTASVPGGVTDPTSQIAPTLNSAESSLSVSSAGPTTQPTPSSPSGQFFADTAGLVGHPSTLNEAISVVGPVTPVGLSPLALNGSGIPQGLSFGYGQRALGPKKLTSGQIEDHLVLKEVDPADRAVIAASGENLAVPESQVDAALMSSPNLFDRAAAIVLRWIPPAASTAPETASGDLDDLVIADLDRVPAPNPLESDEQVETADFSASLGVGVIAVAVATCQHRIGRWMARRRSLMTARRKIVVPDQPRSS